MSTAERNRNIKKVLEQAFGRSKIAVRGSRGTAYGWVSVKIAYAPRNQREAAELRSRVHQLIKAAKIEIGTYGYDDPGSDYGYGSKMNIRFNECREQADAYGPEAAPRTGIAASSKNAPPDARVARERIWQEYSGWFQ